MAISLMRRGAFSLTSLSLPSSNPSLSFLRRSFSALRRRSLRSSASGISAGSKVMLKEMEFSEVEKWVQSHGFRSGQAMMLWKCLYGNNMWALSHDELEVEQKKFLAPTEPESDTNFDLISVTNMASPSLPEEPNKQIEATNLLERLAQLLSQPLPPIQQQPSPLPVIMPAADGGIPPVSIKFNGHNYGLWVQVVEMQLASKDKLGYIDGTLSPPAATAANFKKWKTEDSTVKSWLISSMDPNLIGNFIRFPSARDVWRAVETAYLDRNDRSQLYNLKKQVARLKQSGKPIEVFYNSLQALWQEIDFRRPNPMECPKDIENHNVLVQEDRVYQFLDGLDDRFDKVRGEVLRMTPFPTVDEAFAVIRQEDSHQGAMGGKEDISAPMAMVVNAEKDQADSKLTMAKPQPAKTRPPPSGGCTHCGGTKHTKETCFKLNGYPDWFKDLKKKRQVGQPPGDGNRGRAALASGSGVSLVPIVDGEKVSTEGLNKDFRKMIHENADLKEAVTVKDILTASDGTRKILLSLEDGAVIETVVIPCDRGRTTVCVSSQVGCAMNCQFCYTGRMGLRKHLSTAEIVEQAVLARKLFTSEFGSITNVVFMGMGEPLHNIDNVIKAAAIMVDDKGLHFSPRKVCVSTSGLVPQLKRFLQESNCALAVSLNATTDEVRNWIMPINRKYNLSVLLETLREELQFKHKYKVLFEYVMLAGVNDSIDDAKRLIQLVQGIPCKINLISFNPHEGSQFKPTPIEKMIEFRNVLLEAGCVVLLRLSRGDDQMAACGQLGEPGDSRVPLLRIPQQFQLALL